MRKLQRAIVSNFKFHYVSINSVLRMLNQKDLSPLNSIMFLLIRMSRKEFADKAEIFKFHYVSINSHTLKSNRKYLKFALNSIMFLLIPM